MNPDQAHQQAGCVPSEVAPTDEDGGWRNTSGPAGQEGSVTTTADGQREERFRTLFATAYGDVLRFTQRRVHPTHAEDVVAEAFLAAWRRLDDAPSTPDDLRAWLFGITRNCLLNTRRGQERQRALAVRLAEVESVTSPPDQLAEVVTRRLALVSAWQRLSDTDQEVLALTVFEDLTSPQAGRVLGISSAAYRLRLMRARRQLRAHLDAAAPVVIANPAIEESAC